MRSDGAIHCLQTLRDFILQNTPTDNKGSNKTAQINSLFAVYPKEMISLKAAGSGTITEHSLLMTPR